RLSDHRAADDSLRRVARTRGARHAADQLVAAAGLGATQRRSILPVAERRGFRARYRVRHAAVVGGVGARQSQSRAVSDARLAAEAAVEQHGARHGLGRIPDVVVAILAVLPTAV